MGDDLLVAPILRPGAEARLVYLPEGTWIDYWSGTRYTGRTTIRARAPLETVPLFVRAGAVLPLGPEMSFVGERATDPLTLEIYPDDRGEANGAFYEDDGGSPAYLKGSFRRTEIHVRPSGKHLEATLAVTANGYDPGPRRVDLVVRGGTLYREAVLAK